jgi:L-seryl-tRNA(Ser) seleniumtransferase
MTSVRLIPSIDQLVERPALVEAAAIHGRTAVVRMARHATDALRAAIQRGETVPASPDLAALWIERRTLDELATAVAPSLRRVINATGVIVHTNLGRAPLADAARSRTAALAAGYTNLEYDLDAGRRGHRHVHAERLLRHLTQAEAALVANNNAAGMLLVLSALASSREVIVSRGELVEIGGGFRVPDVLAQSGALLREVGTTNRTRASDYAAAVSDRTALLLRVHPSNFRIEGFTARPTVDELVALARSFQLPLVEDLGSGWLGLDPPFPPGLDAEPTVARSLRAGVDLVAFSGDKLLGGPQAGIVLGRRDLIERLRRHPLMRAVRAGKLTYAALEATLGLWAAPASQGDIPVLRMIRLTADAIDRRARAVAARLAAVTGLSCDIVDGVSAIGGGSAPGATLPTRLLVVRASGLSASALEARLRGADPPVIARIADEAVVLDLRTVADEEDVLLAAAIADAAAGATPSPRKSTTPNRALLRAGRRAARRGRRPPPSR